MRDSPARGATEVDGPTDLVWAENDSGTVIALVESVLTICLDGSLVEVRVHFEISLEQDVWPQLEPDVVAVQNENQIVFLADGLQPLHVSKQSFDFGEMLLVRIGLFMGSPIDQDGRRIVEDGGGEEELAEISVATCCRNEVVETSLAIAG